MVFTVEGQLIGDALDFQEWAKERFGREVSLPKEILIKRAKINQREINEFIRLRDHGPNLISKIKTKKAQIKQKGLVSTFDGFFERQLVDGKPFYTRKTDMAKNTVTAPTEPEELPDFLAQIDLSDQESEESEEEEEFKEILDELPMEDTAGIMDYEKFKEFYAEEIDLKMHRRKAQEAQEHA